jgi:hypothetical protein
MANRPNSIVRIVTLFLLTFAVFTASMYSTLFAETYTVPKTTEVTLAWDPNDPVPEGYRLFQRTEGQAYDYDQPVWQGANTSCTVYNLNYDTNYFFVVRAYDGDLESADSGEVSFLEASSSTTDFTISATFTGNGSISPADTVTVAEGADQSFTISPGADSYLTDVWVDGASVGALSTYTFTQVSQNHTISADFAYYTHSISASADTGGSISPAGSVVVNHGNSQGYTITPDAGYQILDVMVDGVSVGPLTSYTFDQVVEDHTIQASFTLDTVTITASAGTNGTISPAGGVSVNYGGSQSFSITPYTGYQVADVLVDGLSVGPVSSYTFDQAIEDHTIQASFFMDTVTITASTGTNGSISPAGSVNVSIGSGQTFAISPDSGYVVSDVLVDGASVGAIDTYTFSNVAADHTINAVFTLENQPPMADAGPDQTVKEGQAAHLSGLNSVDLDDGIASFQWRQIQGDPVTLAFPNEPETNFTTPNVDSNGTALVFELTVTDYAGAVSTDSCIVNVTWVNTPPTADAGVDQTVNERSQVVLDASNSIDADDGIASYGWTQTSGPVVTLSSANSATPSFIAPDVASAGASLAFQVTVTDTGGLKDTANCLVNVTWVNTPPVADAGPDQNTAVDSEVYLDGSKSYDADDIEIKAYKWSQTGGTPVELSDATAQRPVFVVPPGADQGGPITFELTVTDSGGLQGKDSSQAIVQSLGPTLHISMITMELKYKGPTVEASAYVVIVDEAGSIVKEASVTGNWTYNGNPLNTATTTTRGEGTAVLVSEKISAKSGVVLAVEITDVIRDGYSYDPASSSTTQGSLIVP